MTCYRSQSNWHSYVKKSLDEDELREMTVHLRQCSECRSIVSDIRETASTFVNNRMILIPPIEIKLNVMTTINKDKYKPCTNSTHLLEMKNWGLSLLATGILLFALNATSLAPHLESTQVSDLNSAVGKQIALPFTKMSQTVHAALRVIDSLTADQLK